MKKTMERIFLGSLIVLAPASGFACSTAQWDATSGAIVVGSPQPTPPTVPRVSEFCGMQVTAPSSGHVQDNSPDGHTKFIARFYVRPNISGGTQADLFVAYSAENGTGQLIKVSYDGANFDFHADGAVLESETAAANEWHLIELEYNAAGTTKYWVNADASTENATGDFSTPGAGAVSSVRLGLPNGATGFTGAVQFDSYESHSTTPVGALLIGDANQSGGISPTDLTRVKTEILKDSQTPADATTWLSPGQPDCNNSGSVTPTDLTCIKNIILGN